MTNSRMRIYLPRRRLKPLIQVDAQTDQRRRNETTAICSQARPGRASPVQSCNRFSLSCSACLPGSSDHFAWDARRSLPDAWCLVLVCHEPNTRRSFDTCYPRSKFVATMRKFTFILHFNFVLCGLFNFLFANGINFDAMLEMSSSLPRFVSPSQRNKAYQ